jgi:hypothetical protein
MVRRFVVGACLTVLTAGAGFAQSKPDFSGTWKLNVAKSDFGPLPAPTSRVDVIQHADPSLKDSVTADTAQGKQEYTATYTTDAKEVVNKIGPREVKSTVAWEGNTLVVNSKTSFNDNDITVKSVWSLSADSKTLTQNIHFTSAMGEADQKQIFDKQEGSATPATTTTATKVSGGPKPNFSGVWKLNVAKSDFGVIPGPESRTDTIDHTDPSLKIATKEEGPQGKRDYVMVLTTDGTENVNNPGIEIKSTSTWEGPALVTNTKLKFQDNDVAIKNVMTLSDDGKTLTVNSHLTSAMGETDQKFVYEKQS